MGQLSFYLRLTHSAKKGLSIRYPPTGFYMPCETFLKSGTRTEKLVADGATIFKRAHVPFSFSLCIFALCIFALCSFAQRAYDTTKKIVHVNTGGSRFYVLVGLGKVGKKHPILGKGLWYTTQHGQHHKAHRCLNTAIIVYYTIS